MNSKERRVSVKLSLAAALVGALALAGCEASCNVGGGGDAAKAPAITKAEMGTGETSNHDVVGATTKFAPNTAKIYCVWKAEGIKANTPLKGVWIAEDVGTAAPPNYKIDEASLNLASATQGSFSLTKSEKDFPVGKYRVEIYIGNDLAKTVPFTIAEAEGQSQ